MGCDLQSSNDQETWVKSPQVRRRVEEIQQKVFLIANTTKGKLGKNVPRLNGIPNEVLKLPKTRSEWFVRKADILQSQEKLGSSTKAPKTI